MPEVLPNVHRIPVDYHGRPLTLTLLIGPTASLLMDTGEAATPDEAIMPYFQKIGFDPKKLTYIMATHPDVDHTGGLARMRELAPQALFCCGTVDREQVEDPNALIELRYRAFYAEHGLGPNDEQKAKMLPRCGGYVPMAFTLAGGETIRLGPDWLVEVMHLPGHSHGLLGVYLPEHKTAIVDDAVHQTANRFLDGREAFAPTYMYIDEYFGTIARLKAMRLDRLYSCHWADCTDAAAVDAFLTLSADYARQAEASLLDTVRNAGSPLTLREIILAAKPRLGDWPAQRDMDTRSMAAGHMEHLVGLNLVRRIDERPVKYAAV